MLRAYWVVFPEPVSPTMTMIWCLLNFAKISVTKGLGNAKSPGRDKKAIGDPFVKLGLLCKTHDVVELLHLAVHWQLLPHAQNILVALTEGLLGKRIDVPIL